MKMDKETAKLAKIEDQEARKKIYEQLAKSEENSAVDKVPESEFLFDLKAP